MSEVRILAGAPLSGLRTAVDLRAMQLASNFSSIGFVAPTVEASRRSRPRPSNRATGSALGSSNDLGLEGNAGVMIQFEDVRHPAATALSRAKATWALIPACFVSWSARLRVRTDGRARVPVQRGALAGRNRGVRRDGTECELARGILRVGDGCARACSAFRRGDRVDGRERGKRERDYDEY